MHCSQLIQKDEKLYSLICYENNAPIVITSRSMSQNLMHGIVDESSSNACTTTATSVPSSSSNLLPMPVNRIVHIKRKRPRLTLDSSNGDNANNLGYSTQDIPVADHNTIDNDTGLVEAIHSSGCANIGVNKKRIPNKTLVDVRLSASKVAALCGLGHPLGIHDLPDHWTSLIYQHDHTGLARDAELLGLMLIDEETRMNEVINKLESEGKALATVIAESQTATVRTRNDVAAHVDAGNALVNAVARAGKISRDDADFLREQVRQKASTSFGNRHEDTAIALYESAQGVCVTDSNDQCYVLYLDAHGTAVNGSSSTNTDADNSRDSSENACMDPTEAPPDKPGANRIASPGTDAPECFVLNDKSTAHSNLNGSVPQPQDIGFQRSTTYLSKQDTSSEACQRTPTPDAGMTTPSSPLPFIQANAVPVGAQKLGDTISNTHGNINPASPTTELVDIHNECKDPTASDGTEPAPIEISDTESSEGLQCGTAGPHPLASSPCSTLIPEDSQYPIAIVGYIDGMCEHVVPKALAPRSPAACGVDAGSAVEDSQDDLTLERTVVEIKNRVSQTAHLRPPPFYDLIQCVIYMKMTECTSCDLVEVFRNQASPQNRSKYRRRRRKTSTISNTSNQNETTFPGKGLPEDRNVDNPTVGVNNTNPDNIQIRVTKVPLYGPPAHHADQWDATLAPRLLDIASAIQRVRRSDHERYRWLCALASGDTTSIWDILCEWCSFYVPIRPRDD
eukprot:m.130537 g.130537  ORF g.130537 m.130537 type:complete len:737 (-) comp17471_c0_seq1:282-2492(-)